MAEKQVLPFAARLVKACGEMNNPPLDSKNPHFGNKFASLLAVSNVVRPALAKYGIAYRQSVEELAGRNYVFTYAYGFEQDGTSMVEKVLACVPVTVDANPQKMGSALTYAKRYCLLAAFGLVGDEDDDAEAASTPEKKPARRSAPSKPKAAVPPTPVLTQAEKEELAAITAKVGDKQAVWSAYKANGIDGARALITLAPENIELLPEDAEF